jgi:hypothetical protein
LFLRFFITPVMLRVRGKSKSPLRASLNTTQVIAINQIVPNWILRRTSRRQPARIGNRWNFFLMWIALLTVVRGPEIRGPLVVNSSRWRFRRGRWAIRLGSQTNSPTR